MEKIEQPAAFDTDAIMQSTQEGVFPKCVYDTSPVPAVWGPHFWHMFYSIAHNYPENPNGRQQQDAIKFLTSMESLLPCRKCRTNYQTLLHSRHPLDRSNVMSRSALLTYIGALKSSVKEHEVLATSYEFEHAAPPVDRKPTLVLLLVLATLGTLVVAGLR